MKKFFALLLAALTVLSVFACFTACKKEEAKDDKKAEALGTFVYEKHKYVGDEEWYSEHEWELVLDAEGKGTSKRDGAEYDLTWELDGEKIPFKETFAGITIEYNGTLKDGVLNFFDGDPESAITCEYVFNKK
jgi:hypothetical protein